MTFLSLVTTPSATATLAAVGESSSALFDDLKSIGFLALGFIAGGIILVILIGAIKHALGYIASMFH